MRRVPAIDVSKKRAFVGRRARARTAKKYGNLPTYGLLRKSLYAVGIDFRPGRNGVCQEHFSVMAGKSDRAPYKECRRERVERLN